MEIDILKIDKNIREKWKINKENIDIIDNKIIEINDILNNNNLSIHIVNDLNFNLDKLKDEKKELIDSYSTLNFYIMDVTPIIDKYKNININPKKISFMSKKNNNDNNNDNNI
jgi:hypothetical protein